MKTIIKVSYYSAVLIYFVQSAEGRGSLYPLHSQVQAEQQSTSAPTGSVNPALPGPTPQSQKQPSEADIIAIIESKFLSGLQQKTLNNMQDAHNLLAGYGYIKVLGDDYAIITAIMGKSKEDFAQSYRDGINLIKPIQDNLSKNDKSSLNLAKQDIAKLKQIVLDLNKYMNDWKNQLKISTASQAIKNALDNKLSVRQSRQIDILEQNLTNLEQHAVKLEQSINAQNGNSGQQIDYFSLTLDVAQNLTQKQCEEAIKAGIINKEFFSLGINSSDGDLTTAANNIINAVVERNKDKNANIVKKFESKGYIVLLRILITQNSDLFKDLDFIRAIKNDLMSFKTQYEEDFYNLALKKYERDISDKLSNSFAAVSSKVLDIYGIDMNNAILNKLIKNEDPNFGEQALLKVYNKYLPLIQQEIPKMQHTFVKFKVIEKL